MNPEVNNSTVVTNGPSTNYNGIQLIFNRRYADGFQVQASYTYSKGYQSDFYAFRKAYVEREQTYSNGSASLGNVRHNMAVNWVYDLPFGRGRKWGSGAGGAMNRLIGDWSIMGLVRWQSGRMVDYGNVRLFGMTKEDVAKMHQLRKSADPNNPYRTLVWMLPEDVIDNTIKAFSVSATGYTAGAPTGPLLRAGQQPDVPGDRGRVRRLRRAERGRDRAAGLPDRHHDRQAVRHHGPRDGRVPVDDLQPVQQRELQPGWGTLASSYVGSVKDSYQVTSAVDQSRTMQLAFRILF